MSKVEFFTYKDFRDKRYARPPSPEACAEIANRILAERGTRVYGTAEKLEVGAFEMHLKRYAWATHEAILLPPTPIAPADTVESLLDAAIAFVDAQGTSNILPKLLRDARALLDPGRKA